MNIVGMVGTLGKALWGLKVMYDQDKVNKSEVKELDNFMRDLQQCIQALEKQFKEGGTSHLGNIMLNKVATDITEAVDEVNKWSTDRRFFRFLNAHDRKLGLENMHIKVMSSIQKNLAIASLSVLLDVHASQATIIQQGMEMKSLLTASIESVQGRLLPEVRAQVVEASHSPFADEKFWQEVLAAVDSRHDASVLLEQSDLYEDPITAELMIDPVVASNGHTYCRWTIIDNDMKNDPFNPEEDMAIVVDNLIIRKGLFEAFPKQYGEFQQRRHQYRCNALSLLSNGLLGDAEVALQNVLQWDKNDRQCGEALVQVQGALEKAKGDFDQPSSLSMDQCKLASPVSTMRGKFSSFDGWEESSSVMWRAMPDERDVEEEPTHLNPNMCSKYLEVSTDKLSVMHIGEGGDGAVQANRLAPSHMLLYYFEMTVEDGGLEGVSTIGFTGKNFNNSRHPGWDPNSYGYHGDDGNVFCGQTQGKPYAQVFTTGDTVGAGINYATQEIFFTKNGKLLPSINKDVKGPLYPTIGLDSPYQKVQVNFGQQKFVFDVETMAMDVEKEPTHLNLNMCSKYLEVSTDKLSVMHIGEGGDGAVQANRLAPSHMLLYYFEMTVEDGGLEGVSTIGFTGKNFNNSRHPGWDPNSYGYHGDDGNVFCGQTQGKPYAQVFTTGDTVGAGINYATQEIFFTKNGKLLPSINKDVKGPLYPTIGLDSPYQKVQVNFGQQKFVFDVETMAMDVEKEPTHLNPNMCSKYLEVSTDKLSVMHIGEGGDGAVQANRLAPSHMLLYYFEMTVEDGGLEGVSTIGFTGKNFNNSRHPGWDPNSYGYHGDDGNVFCGQTQGKPYAQVFTTGDTVGAGINYATQEIFFTKNGKLLPSINKDVKGPLYPTIGLDSPYQKVQVNFGQQKFVFDVETMIF